MMTGTTRATPVLLWARAALLATVVVTASVVGHVSADGLLPGPVAMAGLLAAATVASALFLTHQASPLRLVSLLVAGQAAIHGVLTLLAGHGADAGPGSVRAASMPAVSGGAVTERSGSYFDQVGAMHAASLEQLTASASAGGAAGHAAGHTVGHGAAQAGWSHLVEHLAGQSPAMLLAHLVVVAALGLWLALGERALWTVLVLSTTRLHDLAEHVLLLVLGHWAAVLHERVHGSPVVVASRRTVVPLPHLLHHVVAHRGPPALLAA